MATYTDSSAGYADWRSTGRYFAWIAASSLAVGAILLYASGGHIPALANYSATLAFAVAISYICFGLALILALAALGSLLLTTRATRSIIIIDSGVLRKGPRSEFFLPREEILGMTEIPAGPLPRGNTLLITADRRRRVVIPNTLLHYGACLDELRAMGILALPPMRPSKVRILAGWAMQLCAVFGVILFIHGSRWPIRGPHHLEMIAVGLIVLALSSWGFWSAKSL